MLPGGMTPVTQLIAMIRSTAPRSAARLLAGVPADRLPVVIAAMRPADIVRLLPQASPDLRGTLLEILSADQLIEMVQTTSTDQAGALLSVLPHERMSAIVNGVPDRVVLSLLVTLPAIRRNALLEVLSPRRLHVVMSRMYEHEVACALVRANADVVVPHGESDGILLVQTFGWRIVIAARYGDDGRQAVRDAEEAAGRLRGSAVLSVTDQQPAEDVLRYCRESQRQGRPIDAVAWTDSRHDSPLKRTLVGLFR